MLRDFLREVVLIIIGKEANDVADLLTSNAYVNEFILAKKLDLTINQTRNILYKIANYGLVTSIRKKDKKKGWYTYFWKLDVLKSLEFLKDILLKRIDQLNSQIKSRETKQFFVCEKCAVEFNEENALLQNFTCNECGNVFTLKDNTGILKDLKKNLAKVNQDLEAIEEEMKKEREHVEKQAMKKKPKKEIKEKKAKKKIVRKTAKTKLQKKEKKTKKIPARKESKKKKIKKSIFKKVVKIKKPVKKKKK